ncbi:MAG: alpha/beta fold hydrolase [Deltaproteobacteria bacterium]|nr:alpha/beta fold hydrolase [Deltaproteobacteria bacterium]MBN2846670.1 alpha/beta fold hydrolase [Deltaproteobacteria bacterium]
MEKTFNPKPWLRSPHLQSMLASLKIRSLGRNEMVRCARRMIIDGGGGVRLLGYHSVQRDNASRGLVLLLHGWEGSVNSAYMLHTGRYLFERGYNIFRLNLRDHGESHHLNQGLFHGALIEEVVKAAENISSLSHRKPFYIIGFSLGGNFALRIALSSFDKLNRVLCVSPLLDPYKTTQAIDEGLSPYRYYFLRKWKRSLKKKENLFPQLYNFEKAYPMRSLMEITDYFVNNYSDFKDCRDYFRRYTLLDDTFSELKAPVTIYAASDDPVIPVSDYHTLKTNHNMHISLQPYGGHCGFVDTLMSGTWYERRIIETLIEKEKT